MKARSRLFSLAMTTSELLPDSPLFSQTFLSARSDVHRAYASPVRGGCVKLQAFEVERDIMVIKTAAPLCSATTSGEMSH